MIKDGSKTPLHCGDIPTSAKMPPFCLLQNNENYIWNELLHKLPCGIA